MTDEEHVGIVITAQDRGASSTLRKIRGEVAATGGAAAAIGTAGGAGGFLGKVTKEFGGFRQAGRQALTDINRGIGNTGRNLERLGLVGGLGLVALGTGAVRAAGEFEAGMNTINTIAQTTPQKLEQMGVGIRKVFRDTGQDINDLQGAFYDIFSAGITDPTKAQGLLEGATKLGIGGLATTSQAVDLMTTAVNAYGMSLDEAKVAQDQFAKAVEIGKVTVSDIAGTYSDIAALAKQFGVGNDEISASYGFLTAKGKTAGEVTTQMGRAITELIKPNKDLNNLMVESGHNYEKMMAKRGLVETLEQVRTDAKRYGYRGQDLFGRKEGYQYYLSTTGENYEGYKGARAGMQEDQVTGTSEKQAQERMKGLNFQWGRLKANVKDAGITIGTELLPRVADLAQKGADWLSANPEKIKAVARDIGQGFDEAVKFLKGVDWESIAGTLQTAGGFAREVMKAFLGAPQWLQTAVITGWGLNKISGGMLTSLVSTGIKGVIGGTAGILGNRGTSPAAPVYVKDVSGIAGGAGGAAGTGRLGGLLRGGAGIAGVGLMLGQGMIGDQMGKGAGRMAGAMGNIATGFAVAGPIGAAAAAVLTAAAEIKGLADAVGSGQADLREKAAGAKDQSLSEATRNLGNLTRYLGDIQGMDRMLLDTTASKETGAALVNLTGVLRRDARTGPQITQAIKDLEAAQAQAIGHGWTDAAAAIGADIAALKAKTPTAAQIAKAVTPDNVGSRLYSDAYAGAYGAEADDDHPAKKRKRGEQEPGGRVVVKANDPRFARNLTGGMRDAVTPGFNKVQRAVTAVDRTEQAGNRMASRLVLGQTMVAVRQSVMDRANTRAVMAAIGIQGNRAAALMTAARVIDGAQLAMLRIIATRSHDINVTVRPAPITLFVSGRAVAAAMTQETYSRSPMYQGA